MQFTFNTEDIELLKSYPYSINGVRIIAKSYDTLSEKILDLPDEDILAWEAACDEIEKSNKNAVKNNRILLDLAVKELEKFCKMLEFGTYKESKYGKILGEYKEFKMLKKQLEMMYPTWSRQSYPRVYRYMIGTETYRVCKSPSTLMEVVKSARAKREQLQKKALETNKLYILSVKYLLKSGVDVENLTSDEIIVKANDLARDAWITSNFPDGETVDVDDNYCECETWTVGDRRCSCGNRRLELSVEGDLSSGFYGYPEPY